ncbi:MAG: putative ABC transporter permease [Eubacteriales bacterium]|nr:putative ABC transporter permease [Eubacteriales bacterium]
MMERMKQYKARASRRYTAAELTGLFFTFSVLGWLWEVALHIVFDGELVNRGTMLGPWLPIYGAGGVLAVLLLRRFADRPAAVFALGTALCSVIEFSAGRYLEAVYGLRWWDYSMYPLNIDGLVCAQTSLVFGLGCCAAVYLAAPALAERFARLPRMQARQCCVLLLTLFALDFGWSAANPNAGAGVTDYSVQQAAHADGTFSVIDVAHAASAVHGLPK